MLCIIGRPEIKLVSSRNQSRFTNRYVSPDQAAIERFWHIGRSDAWRGQTAIFPRSQGPFIRSAGGADADERELVVGQWGLIPWFSRTAKLSYSTNNARFEEIASKASFKQSWLHGRRCIIPVSSFDEPCWETGRNVWWRFSSADGAPLGLAGLWNTWADRESGELIESYTMLTLNADQHPLMSRMHKPDPKLPPDRQDKRSVALIEPGDADTWLRGSVDAAASLIRPPPEGILVGAPDK